MVGSDPLEVATIETNDLGRARKFYDGVLAEIGYKRIYDLGDTGSAWGDSRRSLYVRQSEKKTDRIMRNEIVASFEALSRSQIDAFYIKAWDLGGTDEAPPEIRRGASGAYVAYVRDPDGNKLAVYCFLEC